jgi:hypothetical protein
MNTRLILTISILSGLVGGLASHYAFPVTAFAQPPAPPPMEVRAQSFVLVDGQNRVAGTITSSDLPWVPQPNQRRQEPTIVILDRRGNEVWRANGASIRQLTDH